MAAKKPVWDVNKPEEVDQFLAEFEYPFIAEVQTLRAIIKGVHPGITEQVKWRAPSFSYKGYMATFNLWETERIHLIFHNGAILNHDSGLLEGSYPDRRMVYFADAADINAKRAALEGIIREWIVRMDAG